MRLGSLLLALFALHATSAFGATVVSSRVDESDSGPPPQWTYHVAFEAADAERNVVRAHIREGMVVIRDRAARIDLRGRFCSRLAARRVRCRLDVLAVGLGNGPDRFALTAKPSDTHALADVDVAAGRGDDRVALGYGGTADGGPGDDLLDSDSEPLVRGATLDGGKGSDVVTGSSAPDYLTGGRDDDVVRGRRGLDGVSGGSGDDRLYGGAGPDRLTDNDDFVPGRDKLFGGRGRDIVESYRFRRRQHPVFVNLNRPSGAGERGEDDSLSGIENVWSGAGDDTLIGNATGNKLVGGSGNDALRGRGGNDTLDADQRDSVSGGRGADNVRTSPAAEASVTCGPDADRITSKARTPEAEAAGPLLGADCERIARHPRGPFGPRPALALAPVPSETQENGDMAFSVFEFECCDETLQLTRPARPFETLDSAPIDASEITLTATGGVLRAKAGTTSDQVVWRFRAGGGG